MDARLDRRQQPHRLREFAHANAVQSMKTPTIEEPGFRQWVTRFGRLGLYLPIRVIEELASDAKRQADLEEETARAETEELRRAHQQFMVKRSAVDPVKIGQHQPEPEEVFRHQVFPDVGSIESRINALKSGRLLADKESLKREAAALESAVERGASRSIVRPKDWRPLLDNLAEELPSFRAPLALIAQAFALAEQGGQPPAVAPILLLGHPGLGKSHFAQRLSEVLRCGHAWLSFDQRTAGTTLRGVDAHWYNTRHGMIFEALGLGKTANPVFVLDELDKVSRPWGGNADMLSQLHAVLEPSTARRIEDVSLRIELDASQIMYVATANDIRDIEAPLLSRFEVFHIQLPEPHDRQHAARQIVASVMKRLGLEQVVDVSESISLLLVDYSPRVIRRATERALAICVSDGRRRLSAEDIEQALGFVPPKVSADPRRNSDGYLH